MADPTNATRVNGNGDKRFPKIPKFYGDPSKDEVTPSGFIRRIEATARAAGWDDENTVAHMEMCFYDRAEIWFLAMKDSMPRDWINDFEEVATDFILRFEPHVVGQRSLATVQDLLQKENEKVIEFCDRLKVLGLRWRNSTPLPQTANNADRRAYVRLGMRAMSDTLLLTFFTLGLKDVLRREVLTRCPATFERAVELAMDYEAGLLVYKRGATDPPPPKGAKVSAIETPEEEEQGDVAAFQQQKYRGAYSGPVSSHCWYCKKKGHVQSKCIIRIKRGDPMVGRDGKPFKKKTVAAVDEEADEEEEGPTDTVSAIRKEIKAQPRALNFLGVA